ncbi:DNA polymerase-3 subunit delta' [Scopulibacillus daqui]|uniref:DNA polymerase III subunit delta' n=1 Tax=Scopulibacillus daqui TaxID=1469162 RepID=A0ABS2Q2G4_9BACL|nr:DNA polymerase III subunit delta' [Scopulibacillus daqui]MBM7646483.1 DNA polymerase-3 subunit delta' [Scopulibacillus daqui]
MGFHDLAKQQKTVSRILTNALRRDQLAHAYLFEGPKGTGKRQAASLLAQAYFCQTKNDDTIEPCQECVNCRRILSGNHPDLVWVKPDGKSIKKEQVSNLLKEFSYRGVESIRKFFVIEEADKMTAQAANSLLKFIEEPSPQTIAVLITEQAHKLLDTIVSRCQTLTFIPLPEAQIAEQLVQQNISEPLAKLSAAVTNDIDEAVDYCHDEWFAKARQLVIQLMEGTMGQSHSPLLMIYDQFFPHFDEVHKLDIGLDFILYWLRDILAIHLENEKDIVFIDQIDILKNQALKSSMQQITGKMSAVLAAKKRLSANVNLQSVMEQLVLRLQGGSHHAV